MILNDGGAGQVELGVEGGQIRLDRRRPERVDDHDRLARAGDPVVEQGLLVVRGLHLGRLVAGNGEGRHALGLGGRLGG